MSIPHNAAEILDHHVEYELECADRLYLNLYLPILQDPRGAAWFWRKHRGYQFASSALMAPMSRAFVSKIEGFAVREGIDVVQFRRGQRKDDIAHDYLARFQGDEGVLFIGKAQEKAKVIRTERRHSEQTGAPYAWLVQRTSMVNQYYFYCVDKDFGPFFIKFCSYFPYNGKLCINGHEYLKRQLAKRGIAFEALDNGIRSCDDPKQAQKLADELTPERIDRLARKWFRKLPHPFPSKDRAAGFCYDISVLQAEFALTQVFDRPMTGRLFFEDIIRENVDLGRPDHVQLIFGRRVTRRTPGRFRTRVITDGVIPSLHVDYKSSRIKQYHKEGRALRTETIINDTYDFKIGRRLENLPALRQLGLQTNRRLLSVQRISHDCAIGEAAFEKIHRPTIVDDQRASALRLDDPRARALFAALLIFHLLPRGFTNKDLREHTAPLLGLRPGQYTQGKMSYDLRRLRLHGLIEKIPGSWRYRVTDFGFRSATFVTRAYNRLLRPGFAILSPPITPHAPPPLRLALQKVDEAVHKMWCGAA
jgi:hypothetical protein